MILYHGSYMVVEKPDIKFSRDNLDFGKGFYTTPIREQADRWAERFRRKKGSSVVSIYELDDSIWDRNYSIKKYNDYSEDWLDYIISCRKGKPVENYDLVIGGVADDKVFNTVELYFDGLIDKKEAIKVAVWKAKPSSMFSAAGSD